MENILFRLEGKSEEQNTNNPTDTHIFLITGDYINPTETNRINSATGMTTSGYNAYWASGSAPAFQTVDSTTLTRFKATEYNINEHKTDTNSQCVSILLDDDNWSSYKDSGHKAEKAIGSPTVEMWMDSWNERYPGNKVYRKASTDKGYLGYYIGTNQNPDTQDIYLNAIGNKNPHTSYYNGTYGYWLASPSANYPRYMLCVYYYGSMFYEGYNCNNLGLRPVVSLNTGITVNAEKTE